MMWGHGEQLRCSFRPTRSLAHWLCVVLLLMSKDVESNPGPGENVDILHFMDWRFSQIWQGMNVNAANICKMVDDKFRTLQQTMHHFTKEMDNLKAQVRQDREDVQDLQDETDTILDRLEKLEQRQENNEMDAKRCNLKFFGIPEPRRGMSYPCIEQIVDVLNDYSKDRTWRLSDVKDAFRIGDPRQYGDDPRPAVVQFSLWTDKMSILTDKEMRGELRQDGIKVTSDLTSRQREMMEFYRKQGHVVYYRNGRLHFADKSQQRNNRNQEYRYNSDDHGKDHTGGERILYDEDWPYLSRPGQNRHDTGPGHWQGQNRSDVTWRKDRSDWVNDHPSDRPTRRRHRGEQQHEHRGDSGEVSDSHGSVLEGSGRAQAESKNDDAIQRGPLHDDKNEEEGSRHELSGQYRGYAGISRDLAGDTEGGRHIAPGHRTYMEVVQTGPLSGSRNGQRHNRPPINKARGLDPRPRLRNNRADDRIAQHRQKEVDRRTDDAPKVRLDRPQTLRHIQMENTPKITQQGTNRNDTVTEHGSTQKRDDHTISRNPLDRDDLAHEMRDCESDTRDDAIIQDKECDVGHRESDNETDSGGQDDTRQDVVTNRTNVDPETSSNNSLAVGTQQNDNVDSHCSDEDNRATMAEDSGQTTQTQACQGATICDQSNTQETSSTEKPDKMPDRTARNRRKNPTAQARHTDCTPQTSRSSSQSNIIDSLRRMGSREKSKEGRQESPGGVRTRIKSVQNR